MASGWSKVIAGANLVAQAAAKQATTDVSKTTLRVADHLSDLGTKAAITLQSSEQFRLVQRTIEQVIVHGNAVGAATMSRDLTPTHDSSIDLSGYDWANDELDRIRQKQHESTSFTGSSSNVDAHAASQTSSAETSTSSEQIAFNTPYGAAQSAPRNNNGTNNFGTKNESHTAWEKPSRMEEMPLLNQESVVGETDDRASLATDNLVSSEHQILPSFDTPDTRLKEGSPVPSTRMRRAMGFASLGAGLAYGTAMEGLSRLVRTSSSMDSNSSMILNESNSDRLVASLCRMRGAALKMGQMLSIQDEALLPPPLVKALQQVRQGANAMPRYQLMHQLESQLGRNWRSLFVEFDEMPFAAASIGQVHRAKVQHGDVIKDVVVKVQYPGVAHSIQSDLRNLGMLVKWTGLAPKGLFIENVIRVGEKELQVECDYRREMLNQRRIKALIDSDHVLQSNKFVVPDVMMHLTSEQVLTSEYKPGGTIDKVAYLSQDERNRIGRTILYLTMKELFEWRFMQTDPNWGNFLYDPTTRTTTLIDFGATREYSKEFVDGYLRIVWASANQDEETLMAQSHAMSFLTGEENAQMIRAHKLSGYTVGEPFHKDVPFDFRGSNISFRMGEHTSVFLSHRLTPPPEEVYTLHRKLAGAYMLCIKLGAVVRCRDMLEDIVRNHNFDDGPPPKL